MLLYGHEDEQPIGTSLHAMAGRNLTMIIRISNNLCKCYTLQL